MTLSKIIGWLTTDEAQRLVVSGEVKNLKSVGYGSDVPTVCDDRETHSWSDYISAYPEDERAYIEALRQVILAKQFRASIYWMDWGARWVPQFEDGTILDFSSGNWCDLQAAIWSEEEGISYSWQDWDNTTGSEEPVRDRSGNLSYQFKHYFTHRGEAP